MSDTTHKPGNASFNQEVGTESEVRTPASLPMYIAGFIVTGCGLFAVSNYLGDDPFTRLIFGLTILGFIVSYVIRQQNVSPRNIELPALIICGCVFFMGIFSDQPFLAPASVGDDRHRSLAVLLTWLTVFRSYTLINDGALMFCCVPTIAMIGLISTNTTESTLVTVFVTFVAAASFLMVHENFLRARFSRPTKGRGASPALMFGSQIQVAAACVIGSVLLANVVVVPLRGILTQVQMTAGLPSLANKASNVTTVMPSQITERDQVSIGTGPVSQSDQVLLHVQAPEPDYWRGTTFDRYTGHGWRNTLAMGQKLRPQDTGQIRPGSELPSAFHFTVPSSILSATGPTHKTMRQRISYSGSMFTQIYAASEPREISMAQSLGSIDSAGTITLDTPVTTLEYEVESDIADTTPEVLRKTSTDYPTDIVNNYLQLPIDTTMIDRWHAKALEVTKGQPTVYDKVNALNQWVGTECKYNLKSAAVPSNQDVVDTFLFKQKEGYCDSFASSLAMLCRTLGIPARVASGFLTGERDTTKKEFIVRERDKHQWTEVYFHGAGWVRFDPTEWSTDITPEGDTGKDKKKGLLAALFARGWLPPVTFLAFLAMLAYVVKVELWDRFKPRRLKANPLGLQPENLAVIAAYDTACTLLGKHGLKKYAWETVTEFRDRAERVLTVQPGANSGLEPLNRLTALMATSRYSGLRASEDDVRLAREAVTSLQTSLRTVRKRDIELALAGGVGG